MSLYNQIRLHSALGYVTPADKLFGLENVIHQERDRKLEAARDQRRHRRQAARQPQDQADRPSPPRPTPATSPPAAWVDFRNLRQIVTIEQVLQHLGYFHALRGPDPQRRGPCPLHDQPRSASDRSP